MCTTERHAFTWTGSTTNGDVPAGLLCQCGSYRHPGTAPLDALRLSAGDYRIPTPLDEREVIEEAERIVRGE